MKKRVFTVTILTSLVVNSRIVAERLRAVFANPDEEVFLEADDEAEVETGEGAVKVTPDNSSAYELNEADRIK